MILFRIKYYSLAIIFPNSIQLTVTLVQVEQPSKMKGKLNYNEKNQIKKISKKKILKKALSLTWYQFATTSTIHGIPHIVEPKASKTTK